jgi:hypothetical protein
MLLYQLPVLVSYDPNLVSVFYLIVYGLFCNLQQAVVKTILIQSNG